MKCPYCGKDVPEDALFCPYCGHRLVKYVPVEDVEELKKIASMLNEYIPKDWKCSIDKKKRRIMFTLGFKSSFFVGFTKKTNPASASIFILNLEHSLRRAEEELNIKLELNESSIVWNVPTLYYKVLRKEEKKH